jgi:hypothetical protein
VKRGSLSFLTIFTFAVPELLDFVLSGETAHTNFSLWFDPTMLKRTIYHTRGECANYYITTAVCKYLKLCSYYVW